MLIDYCRFEKTKNIKIMSNSNSSSGGIGLFGLLGVTFIVLKLIGIIDWSWWLVTLPLWGGLAIVLVVILVLLIIDLVMRK